MSKPGRKYKYEGLGSPLGASRGGEEAGAEDAHAARTPVARALLGGRAREQRQRQCQPEGPFGDRCRQAPTGHAAGRTPELLAAGTAGRLPAPARAGPASSVSRAAAAAPMPRAAPGWPPLLLLLLLLLLLVLLLPPLALGAPTRPGEGEPASALVVPTRLPGGAGELALHLSAFGRGFVLRLEPDASFLAPEFKIERLGGSGGAAGGERELRDCFFSGTVNGEPESLAAVSLCRGLSGSFLLDGEEFTIQPQGAGDSLQQPHRLQRWGPGRAAAEAQPLLRAPEWEAEKGEEGQRQETGAGAQEEEEEEEEGEKENEESEEEEAGGATELPPTLGATSRTKRFVSEARFVETLLVADASMVAFYGADLQVGLALP